MKKGTLTAALRDYALRGKTDRLCRAFTMAEAKRLLRELEG